MTVSPAGEVPAWTLGDRLRKAREHARLSQEDLAAQLDMNRATISNYETGKHPPARVTVLSWAMICGVDPEWLMGPNPGGGVASRAKWTALRGVAAVAAAVPAAAVAIGTMAALGA